MFTRTVMTISSATIEPTPAPDSTLLASPVDCDLPGFSQETEEALLTRLREHINARLAPAPVTSLTSIVEEVLDEIEFRKRCLAMGNVSTALINGVSSVKRMTVEELTKVSDELIKLIVKSYLHMVTGSANVGIAHGKWFD